MYTFETYKNGTGFGYYILCDGTIIINQPTKPTLEGNVLMNKATSELLASELCEKLNTQQG